MPSFQTVSELMVELVAIRLVPPQASTQGLDAGKSTWGARSDSPSEEPLSPDATQTEMPNKAASWKAAWKAFMACEVHSFSGEPQLIEITDGWRTLS